MASTTAATVPLPDHHVMQGDRALPTGMACDRRTGHFSGCFDETTTAEDGTGHAAELLLALRPPHDRGRPEAVAWLGVERAGVEWIDGQHNLNGIIAAGHRHLLAAQRSTG